MKCRMCGRDMGNSTGYAGFCSDGCRMQFELLEQQKKQSQQRVLSPEEIAAARAEAAERRAAKEAKKQAKKEAKEAPKREKIANAKITSDKSLSDISKKCLTLGLLGVHRFAVGKFFTGLCMPGLVVFAIAMAVSNKDPGMLLIALGDVFWWLYDLCRIKAKMFTDKSGHTVREG